MQGSLTARHTAHNCPLASMDSEFDIIPGLRYDDDEEGQISNFPPLIFCRQHVAYRSRNSLGYDQMNVHGSVSCKDP